MTSTEYQNRAVALESTTDDAGTTAVPSLHIWHLIRSCRHLDLAKRRAFYEKKPTDERRRQYQEDCAKFSSMLDGFEMQPFGYGINHRILHGIIGLATEVGEIFESLVTAMHEGQPIDENNLVEELGDLEWYMALIRDEIGVPQELVQSANIRKLETRYGAGQQFGGERDLAAEQAAMREVK